MTVHDTPTRPPVVNWYTVYAIAMAVLYLFVLLGGILFLSLDPEVLEVEPMEARVNGVVFTSLGAVFTLLFALAPVLPRLPWVWAYKLVTICLSLTSCCCLPAAIPLLIFWLRPEVRQYYGLRS